MHCIYYTYFVWRLVLVAFFLGSVIYSGITDSVGYVEHWTNHMWTELMLYILFTLPFFILRVSCCRTFGKVTMGCCFIPTVILIVSVALGVQGVYLLADDLLWMEYELKYDIGEIAFGTTILHDFPLVLILWEAVLLQDEIFAAHNWIALTLRKKHEWLYRLYLVWLILFAPLIIVLTYGLALLIVAKDTSDVYHIEIMYWAFALIMVGLGVVIGALILWYCYLRFKLGWDSSMYQTIVRYPFYGQAEREYLDKLREYEEKTRKTKPSNGSMQHKKYH